MSVLTLVQRALPSSLPWKRRSSASSSTKGKEKELDSDNGYDYTQDSDFPEKTPSEITIPASPSPPTPTSTRPLHRDVSRAHALHIAVKAGPDHTHPPHESKFGFEFEFESGSGSGSSPETGPGSGPRSGTDRLSRVSRRSAFCREVSWASIVRSRCRWTNEQERELVMANRQLARCQKAWSSEQELWLSYIQELSEEKEAHEGFVSMRMRQQEDERNQFRKAWRRRRSVESMESDVSDMEKQDNTNGFLRMRRLQLQGYLSPGLSKSPAVTCQG